MFLFFPRFFPRFFPLRCFLRCFLRYGKDPSALVQALRDYIAKGILKIDGKAIDVNTRDITDDGDCLEDPDRVAAEACSPGVTPPSSAIPGGSSTSSSDNNNSPSASFCLTDDGIDSVIQSKALETFFQCIRSRNYLAPDKHCFESDTLNYMGSKIHSMLGRRDKLDKHME